MRTKITLVLAFLVIIGGCGEKSTPLPNDIGQIEFVLAGARTLTFDVTGKNDQLTDGKDFVVASYAPGYPNNTQTVLQIAARDMTDTTSSNRIFVQTPRIVAGTYGIGTDCVGGGPAVCGHVAFWLNEDYRHLGSGESFLLISGVIELVSTPNNRVRGRFSGMARQLDPAAPTAFLEPPVLVQVRVGSFDVPLSPN